MQQKEQEEEIFINEDFIQVMQKVIIELNGIYDIKKYIGMNKPSFNLILKQFEKLLELDKDIQEKFYQNLQKILEELLKNNVQRIFIRVLIQYLNDHKDQIDVKQFQNSEFANIWKYLQGQELQEFIEIFQLKAQITQENLQQYFQELINKKKFQDAYLLYESLKLPKECFDNLILQMGTKREASRAAEFIIQQNANPDNYPNIIERLQKNAVRYLAKEYTWFQCEEMMLLTKSLLVYYCEDEYFHGKKIEALSIIKRNNLINDIKKQDLKEQMLKDLQEGIEEIPNILFQKDQFQPTEEFVNNEIDAYLHCKDFGYAENNIIFIDKVDQNYLDAWKFIHSSNAVGYDCEFKSPWTKLDHFNFKVCLVQIATSNHSFLFDYQKLKDCQEFRNDITLLFENVEIMKIGQSVKEDLEKTAEFLKINNIIIRSILELSTCFKQIQGEPRIKSLSYTSQFYFKKKLSKFETCSNWELRPLRKAQIHYAALDAIVSLQIYLAMKVKNSDILEQEKDVFSFVRQK